MTNYKGYFYWNSKNVKKNSPARIACTAIGARIVECCDTTFELSEVDAALRRASSFDKSTGVDIPSTTLNIKIKKCNGQV